MLRGLVGVVGPQGIEVGRFYLRHEHSGAPSLWMRVRFPEAVDASDLHFEPAEGHGLWFYNARDSGPVVALPPVHVRVDPKSLMGSPFTMSSRPGPLFVVGERPFVQGAWHQGRGSRAVDLSNGPAVQTSMPSDWLAFARWSLVVDDGDNEVVLASFDASS